MDFNTVGDEDSNNLFWCCFIKVCEDFFLGAMKNNVYVQFYSAM